MGRQKSGGRSPPTPPKTLTSTLGVAWIPLHHLIVYAMDAILESPLKSLAAGLHAAAEAEQQAKHRRRQLLADCSAAEGVLAASARQ